MDRDILIKLKNILRDHGEIFFPVKELYNIQQLRQDLPPIDELVTELKAQSDLVVTQNFKTGEENDPIVMLRERVPTLDEIIAKVRSSLGGSLENLNSAYVAGIGQMASDEEDLLLEAMQRTKKLGIEMERMFAEAKQRPRKNGKSRKERA